MKLFHFSQKINQWLSRGRVHVELANDNSSEKLHDCLTELSTSSAQESTKHSEFSDTLQPKREPIDQRGMKPKVIEWRRRVLVRKGARLHAAMLEQSDGGSLAMLDALGVVVSWYEGPDRGLNMSSQDSVLRQHVSQFYVPADVATNVVSAHLEDAASAGSSIEHGWRKRSDGSTYWATTVIQPIALQGGPVQGFSHIVRERNDSAGVQTRNDAQNFAQPEVAHNQLTNTGADGVMSTAGAP